MPAYTAPYSSTRNNTLMKLHRAIARAQASNPVDQPVLTTLPTVTTAYDSTVANFFLVDSLVNGGTAYFNLLGGAYYDCGTVSGSIHGHIVSSTSYNGTSYTNSGVLEFYSDAPRVQIRGGQGTWRIEVNGQFISKTGNATVAGSGEQQLVMDWSGVRQTRLYRVHCSGSGFYSRVGVDTLSRVWAPSKDDVVRVAYYGDSYVQGVGSSYPDNNFADVASACLGFGDCWHTAFGGTGFLNPGSYTTFRGHVSDVINANPDIIIIAGGTNDATYGAAAIQAEVLLLLQTLRAALPNTPIVVLGVWPKNTGPSTAITTVENAVSAAVTQFADPFCVFEPVATDGAGAWIFGTGYQGATNGSGNSDLYIYTDATHPNDSGHDFVGRKTAQAVRNALMTMTAVKSW